MATVASICQCCMYHSGEVRNPDLRTIYLAMIRLLARGEALENKVGPTETVRLCRWLNQSAVLEEEC